MSTVLFTQKEEFSFSLISAPLTIPLVPINDLLIRIEVLNKEKREFSLEFRLFDENEKIGYYRELFHDKFKSGNVSLKINENPLIKRIEAILMASNGYKPQIEFTIIKR